MHVCLTLRGKRCGPEDSSTIDCMALSSRYSCGVVSHNNCSVSVCIYFFLIAIIQRHSSNADKSCFHCDKMKLKYSHCSRLHWKDNCDWHGNRCGTTHTQKERKNPPKKTSTAAAWNYRRNAAVICVRQYHHPRILLKAICLLLAWLWKCAACSEAPGGTLSCKMPPDRRVHSFPGQWALSLGSRQPLVLCR